MCIHIIYTPNLRLRFGQGIKQRGERGRKLSDNNVETALKDLAISQQAAALSITDIR